LEQSIEIPARFVWIPLEQAQDWVATITHLSVPIGEPDNWDEPEQRRRLRVDLGWIDHLFDKRWCVHSAGHEVLNRSWEQVWEEMGALLRTVAPLSDSMPVEESFRVGDEPTTPYHYDISSFDPQW